jgi:hypothetical protein
MDELQVRRDAGGSVEPEPEHRPSSMMPLFYDVGITVKTWSQHCQVENGSSAETGILAVRQPVR